MKAMNSATHEMVHTEDRLEPRHRLIMLALLAVSIATVWIAHEQLIPAIEDTSPFALIFLMSFLTLLAIVTRPVSRWRQSHRAEVVGLVWALRERQWRFFFRSAVRWLLLMLVLVPATLVLLTVDLMVLTALWLVVLLSSFLIICFNLLPRHDYFDSNRVRRALVLGSAAEIKALLQSALTSVSGGRRILAVSGVASLLSGHGSDPVTMVIAGGGFFAPLVGSSNERIEIFPNKALSSVRLDAVIVLGSADGDAKSLSSHGIAGKPVPLLLCSDAGDRDARIAALQQRVPGLVISPLSFDHRTEGRAIIQWVARISAGQKTR
jgi:hypothetical protein